MILRIALICFIAAVAFQSQASAALITVDFAVREFSSGNPSFIGTLEADYTDPLSVGTVLTVSKFGTLSYFDGMDVKTDLIDTSLWDGSSPTRNPVLSGTFDMGSNKLKVDSIVGSLVSASIQIPNGTLSVQVADGNGGFNKVQLSVNDNGQNIAEVILVGGPTLGFEFDQVFSSASFTFTAPSAATLPEPTSLCCFGLAAVGLLVRAKRKQRS
jgi:hypothetical protein